MFNTDFVFNSSGNYDVVVNRKGSSGSVNIGCLVHLSPTACEFIPIAGDPNFSIIDNIISKAYELGYSTMKFRFRRGAPKHPVLTVASSDNSYDYYNVDNLCHYCIDNSLI